MTSETVDNSYTMDTLEEIINTGINNILSNTNGSVELCRYYLDILQSILGFIPEVSALVTFYERFEEEAGSKVAVDHMWSINYRGSSGLLRRIENELNTNYIRDVMGKLPDEAFLRADRYAPRIAFSIALSCFDDETIGTTIFRPHWLAVHLAYQLNVPTRRRLLRRAVAKERKTASASSEGLFYAAEQVKLYDIRYARRIATKAIRNALEKEEYMSAFDFIWRDHEQNNNNHPAHLVRSHIRRMAEIEVLRGDSLSAINIYINARMHKKAEEICKGIDLDQVLRMRDWNNAVGFAEITLRNNELALMLAVKYVEEMLSIQRTNTDNKEKYQKLCYVVTNAQRLGKTNIAQHFYEPLVNAGLSLLNDNKLKNRKNKVNIFDDIGESLVNISKLIYSAEKVIELYKQLAEHYSGCVLMTEGITYAHENNQLNSLGKVVIDQHFVALQIARYYVETPVGPSPPSGKLRSIEICLELARTIEDNERIKLYQSIVSDATAARSMDRHRYSV